MLNGKPPDYIELEPLRARLTISNQVRDVIRRLHGQLFTGPDIEEILRNEYGRGQHTALTETVRQFLYDGVKSGYLCIHAKNCGRGGRNVYQESKHAEAGSSQITQSDMETETAGEASQASQG